MYHSCRSYRSCAFRSTYRGRWSLAIRFEVLVQPSRHAPVAVVERVERAVLEPELQPELLRQLVPAEALLQREDNAKTTRRSRAAAGASRVGRRSAGPAGM